MTQKPIHSPVVSAGVLLGIGLGGFVDGILFHQILQWHGMLTGKYPRQEVDTATALINLEVNMFWDGLFHAFTWLVTAIGVALLWRAGKHRDVAWSTPVFAGSLPFGWGLFNLIEGLINHHLLHLHHVVEGVDHLYWDLAFLLSGIVLMLIGMAVMAAGSRKWQPARWAPRSPVRSIGSPQA